ncbi:MAG TPA: CvpA family protein [Acholeplasmataceae bacterium]|nr:CvpA family protein [Acholeplasmataceae bacterium]
MLEVFHFDIIIIIVVLYSIIIGMYRGFYKQLLQTLALAIPIVIISLFYNDLDKLFSRLPFVDKVINYAYKGGKYFLNLTIETTKALLIIIVSFLVMYLFLKLIIRLLFITGKHNIARRKTLSSRLIGVSLGLCSGYGIILLLLVLITPIITNLGTGPLYINLLKIIPKVWVF